MNEIHTEEDMFIHEGNTPEHFKYAYMIGRCKPKTSATYNTTYKSLYSSCMRSQVVWPEMGITKNNVDPCNLYYSETVNSGVHPTEAYSESYSIAYITNKEDPFDKDAKVFARCNILHFDTNDKFMQNEKKFYQAKNNDFVSVYPFYVNCESSKKFLLKYIEDKYGIEKGNKTIIPWTRGEHPVTGLYNYLIDTNKRVTKNCFNSFPKLKATRINGEKLVMSEYLKLRTSRNNTIVLNLPYIDVMHEVFYWAITPYPEDPTKIFMLSDEDKELSDEELNKKYPLYVCPIRSDADLDQLNYTTLQSSTYQYGGRFSSAKFKDTECYIDGKLYYKNDTFQILLTTEDGISEINVSRKNIEEFKNKFQLYSISNAPIKFNNIDYKLIAFSVITDKNNDENDYKNLYMIRSYNSYGYIGTINNKLKPIFIDNIQCNSFEYEDSLYLNPNNYSEDVAKFMLTKRFIITSNPYSTSDEFYNVYELLNYQKYNNLSNVNINFVEDFND